MNQEQELTEARRLLWELHKLGGPSPDGMDAAEILRRYRHLLAAEAGEVRGGPQPDPG